MSKEMSVSEYMTKYNISRNAVHRRIRKFEETALTVNNITDVKRIGDKIIVLFIDTKIKFVKKEQ